MISASIKIPTHSQSSMFTFYSVSFIVEFISSSNFLHFSCSFFYAKEFFSASPLKAAAATFFMCTFVLFENDIHTHAKVMQREKYTEEEKEPGVLECNRRQNGEHFLLYQMNKNLFINHVYLECYNDDDCENRGCEREKMYKK